jgi:GNAT superfamily N-acetyltransferase
MLQGVYATTSMDLDDKPSRGAVVLWDHQNCLPLGKTLSHDDIITLLTPVVVPLAQEAAADDPFEPFGRALAARHPKIRHVPYTKKSGITSTHVAFIKRARVVIFVLSGIPSSGEATQVKFADIARILGEQRPQVIVACFSVQQYPLPESFPTIVQISGYTQSDLEAAAELIFGDTATSLSPEPSILEVVPTRRQWEVESWKNEDLAAIHGLWCQAMPTQFRLDLLTLGPLLNRDGYERNFVVREPENRTVVGFCATYTTYVDGSKKLTGSLAVLIVEKSYRGRGVGLSLHNHALRLLERTPGMVRLQLGSTFPRLLYGLQPDMHSAAWFERRGWSLDQQGPGRGREICDWLLRFEDLPQRDPLSSTSLEFRPCGLTIPEYDQVLAFVERESARMEVVGWYDQYLSLKGSMNMQDVILAMDGNTIVATALTYVYNEGSPVATDLPWAKTIGEDVGGVTCICITGTS